MTPIKSSSPFPSTHYLQQQTKQAISDADIGLPDNVSGLISEYATEEPFDSLAALQSPQYDSLLSVLRKAFTSSDCDPDFKQTLIDCFEKRRPQTLFNLLIVDLLDSGRDVFFNSNHFCHAGDVLGLFTQLKLIGKTDLLPGRGKVHFSNANLTGNLQGSHLPAATFHNATLSRSNFSGSNLQGADFTGARLDYVDFSSLVMIEIDTLTTYKYAQPVRTNLRHAKFNGCDLQEVNFEGTDISHADFTHAFNLGCTHFSGATAQGVNLFTRTTTGAPFERQMRPLKWMQLYIDIYGKFPTFHERTRLTKVLENYDIDQLLCCRAQGGLMQRNFSEFVAFSKQPGGGNCATNLWLIGHGIFPVELEAYNQLVGLGSDRMKAVRTIIASRKW